MTQRMNFVFGIFLVILVFATSIMGIDFQQQNILPSSSIDQVSGVQVSEKHSKIFEIKDNQGVVQVAKENTHRTLTPLFFEQVQESLELPITRLTANQNFFGTIFQTISIRKLLYPSHFFW